MLARAAARKGAVIAELKRLAREHGGLLRPKDVVNAARTPRSPLHARFEWDDTVAAEEYRLWQARQLMRVVVEVVPETNEPVEVFVSLTTDRRDGGYRVQLEVLSDAEMREQLLKDALAELMLFRRKYSRLKELSEIFSAIDAVTARNGKRKQGTSRPED